MVKKFHKRLFLTVIVLGLSACTKYGLVVDNKVLTNTKQAIKQPYVILVSLDGFRWDYVERFKPPHLSQFIKNGVKAESLIPSFPSKTFPNHYTIATGMYPDNHNIIGNSFFDYEKKARYSINNRKAVEDGEFYSGTPIWVHAAQTGMVTSSYFFVGTEAEIKGLRPTNYYNYDGKVLKQERVNQVLKWLKLPKKQRPHLITLYFEDMDDTGHDYGPNQDEKLKQTLYELDEVLGHLFKGVADTKLPVNIIFVSDHGMMNIPVDNYIPREIVKNDDLYSAIDNGSLINIHPHKIDKTDDIFKNLKTLEKKHHLKVYKTENTPGFEYVPKNKNWGSIQVVADDGYYFSSEYGIEKRKQKSHKNFGAHGFDPIIKDMHGIFYANGPNFKKGITIPSFKNIHIYPLMCQILGLPIPESIDGNIDQLINIIKPEK